MIVPVRGAQLSCDVLGDGPPLLFIHGFPLCAEMWRPAVERLRGAYRCIVPDLRGFGRSTLAAGFAAEDRGSVAPAAAAQGEPFGINCYADDLAALLEAIGERRPVTVIGLSMGGIIALEFYRRHRAKLRALVLVCTRANAEAPEGVARRETVAQSVLAGGARVLADQMIDNLLAPSADPAVRRAAHDMMAAQPPDGVAAGSRALARRADSFPTLPLIDCPTLVIAGEQDAITPPDLAREMHAKIPGSKLVIISGAGHMPPMEQVEAFFRAIVALIAP